MKCLFALVLLLSINSYASEDNPQQKKILVTACDEPFFERCLTLISSAHATSFDIIDQIFVYDLGLRENSINTLKKLKKVTVKHIRDINISFPNNDHDFFYKKLENCAWKQVCIHDASSVDGDLVFWLDANIMLVASAAPIYALIEQDDIFIVDVVIARNYTWIHPTCIEIMNASEAELLDTHAWAGIQGYKKGGKYQQMMNEALHYSLIKECVDGHRAFNYGTNIVGQDIKGHRQDQSILSILVSRYHPPKHHIKYFGEWRRSDSLTWSHRGSCKDHSGLLYNE